MSTTMLKIIALITMIIDHIGVYIPNTSEYLRYIGRISAPIFLFCSVLGYINTHNKKKYLFRIYIFSIFMGFIDAIILVNANYIRTIFMTLIIIFFIDCFRNNIKFSKKYLKLFIIYQIVINIFFIIYFATYFINIPERLLMIIFPIFMVPMYMEYGVLFVLLGILMYMFINSRKKFIISYIIITLCILILQNTKILLYIQRKGMIFLRNNEFLKDFYELTIDLISSAYLDIQVIFLENNLWYMTQWLMIFALPILLLYNGKKGKGFKYLFYIMYPLNIILLNLISKVFT